MNRQKGYSYDVFGSIEESGNVSFLNEVTFTGSVTDKSTGLQYMNARFYDPGTGRFISQDSYSGNPYDPWTQHLYTYCGNNPTNMVDPTGHTPWWSNVLNFAQQAFQYAGNLAMADGPAYVADIVSLVPIAVGIVSAAVAGVGYLVDEISTAVSKAQSANTVIGGSETMPGNPPVDNSNSNSNAKSEAGSKSQSRTQSSTRVEEVEIAEVPKRHQAYFPANPNDFAPRGLVRTDYPGTKNGRIIKWKNPMGSVIFEWNEDLKYGSHYHAMLPAMNGRHDGIHYYPYTPVPEPWNTIYF